MAVQWLRICGDALSRNRRGTGPSQVYPHHDVQASSDTTHLPEREIFLIGEFDFEGGGPYRSFERMVKILAAEGFFVHVATFPGIHNGVLKLSRSQPTIKVHGLFPFRVHPPNPLRKPLGYLIESLAIHRYLSKIGFTGKLIFSLISPGRFLWRWNANTRASYLFRSYTIGPLHRLAGPYFRFLSSKNSRLLGVSKYTIETIANTWGLSRSNDQLGYLRNSTGSTPMIPKKLGLGVRRVLMVGRVHADKNPEYWIEVASEALGMSPVDLQFIWIGDGDLIDHANERVAELNLQDKVVFKGFVDDPNPHYKTADLYLHLACVEPMSNALIDALRFGLPAVASSEGGNPEAVMDGSTGFLVPLDDAGAVARAIVRLATDRGLYASFSKASVELFAERFSESVLREGLLREAER